MKKYLMPVLFLNCLLTSQLFSQQPCNDDIIMNTKGAWKNTSDANYMKAGNQAQVTSRIDKMQKLLQAAYPGPKGIEANPDYFDNKLPRHVPGKAEENFKDQLESNFDFTALKNMIDK